eukprot:2941441-Rhodomonas_salina.2
MRCPVPCSLSWYARGMRCARLRAGARLQGRCEGLRRVVLAGGELCEAAAGRLAHALSACPALTHLDLSRNQVPPLRIPQRPPNSAARTHNLRAGVVPGARRGAVDAGVVGAVGSEGSGSVRALALIARAGWELALRLRAGWVAAGGRGRRLPGLRHPALARSHPLGSPPEPDLRSRVWRAGEGARKRAAAAVPRLERE